MPQAAEFTKKWGKGSQKQYVHFKLLFVTKHRQDSENVLNDCFSKTAV
jgi:hypothetical protein